MRHTDGVQGGTEEEIDHLPDGGKNGRLYKNATETRSQKLFPRHNIGKSRAGNVSEGRARPKESLSRGSERADDM